LKRIVKPFKYKVRNSNSSTGWLIQLRCTSSSREKGIRWSWSFQTRRIFFLFFPCKSWRRNALVFFIFSLRTSFGDSVRLCHAGIFLSHENGSEFFSYSINLLIFYFKINTIYLKYWWNNIIYKIIYFTRIIIFTCCVLKP